MSAKATPVASYLIAPWRRLHRVTLESMRADVVSGITLAVVLLPQAIAFALVAGLPPQTGLVAAIIGAIVGALWGSATFVHTGPTSAVSLLVLSSVAASTASTPSEMVLVAGLLAVLAGVIQVVLGVARLGLLVNFVSDAVIVGFAAGAGVQIAVSELRHLVGVDVASRGLFDRLQAIAVSLPEANLAALVIGVGTIACLLLLRWTRPSWPGTLIVLILATAVVGIVGPDALGIDVLGVLPAAVPVFQPVPIFDSALVSSLATGALAVAAIGLIQTMAVARSLPATDSDRLDANQEFVGQGLSNIAAGAFSGFAVSGSFSRSAVAAETGARTPMAAVVSGLVVLVVTLVAGPVGAFLPRAALAGILVVVAIRMIDVSRMRRIVRSGSGETVVMAVTGIGTLLLPIDVAVLAGILSALTHYVLLTSKPDVVAVRSDASFRHFVRHSRRDPCTQLAVFDIRGDLYFGATTHVEDAIRSHIDTHPDQRFLLLRMQGVHRLDVSGIQMLERLVAGRRDVGGDVYLTRVQRPVLRSMIRMNFHEYIGRDRFLAADDAIETLFHHVLDPATCVYECRLRAFRECQTIPRPEIPLPVLSPEERGAFIQADHARSIESVSPTTLWADVHDAQRRPVVLDVREPREYERGHIPGALNLSFRTIVATPDAAWDAIRRAVWTKASEDPSTPPADAETGAGRLPPIVLVCRGGRRSRTAAHAIHELQERGDVHATGLPLRVLEGGMLAWEADHLLTASGPPAPHTLPGRAVSHVARE